ncbi:heme anaerobic degradation radical SAM methyltransferase ChuW/HutW [Vibrio sp. SS-MA-C1-2]|uniref:heme anaerobic degradation radical SAM methyltransferase ChuW/HutW n=1 Tax=Vibrio sp. SS-MA-C1-2 TaxID=2908646 RepID=UPI001F340FED|nr:heme anaerobic degradation radical SAM methyltransferase ChuW/HutW [Vibrio sp. SS-MA-C1-2]UJF17336.1 heme anaerobic degradation radical SAM methyltransferase ChuW/HutW [Vibrio sp. SS-MA-C1-2]
MDFTPQLSINLMDLDLVGRSTPDPLRFAFSHKRGAHAGGNMAMVPPVQIQQQINAALQHAHLTERNRCLYIHIPFCRVRCTYCNFFQYASSKTLIEQYFAILLEEIKWKAAQPWTQAAPFQAVYVGGGTPTDLSAIQLKQLGNAIHDYFPLTPDCEMTLEGRINRFNDHKFESALEGGFNRFSFGVQSFNTQVRRSAKRLDDGEDVFNRLQHFISYKSAPIVLDLLYGLPYQNLDNWQQDLENYLALGADGVDLYQLIEMQGLPMADAVAKGKLPHPADTPTKATMYKMGVEFMNKHHQRRLSVNHWASSNRERSIYNSLAKTTAEVLPIGAGAGGNIMGLNMMQSREMESYIKSIKEKQHPVMGAMKSRDNDPIIKYIKSAFDHGVMSGVMLNNVTNQTLSQLIENTQPLNVPNCALYRSLQPLFDKWQQNGLAINQDNYLSLTLAGQFWSTTLAQSLISVLQQNWDSLLSQLQENVISNQSSKDKQSNTHKAQLILA